VHLPEHVRRKPEAGDDLWSCSMPNILGPCIGNRFAGSPQVALKPHLRERLALASCRSTALGRITTGPDGRLSFVPNYVLAQRAGGDSPAAAARAFLPGTRVRVTALVAQLLQQQVCRLDGLEAETVAGREGVVVAHSVCSELGLVAVDLDGLCWALMPHYLTQARASVQHGAVGYVDPLRAGR
jgi:hypothetical protein